MKALRILAVPLLGVVGTATWVVGNKSDDARVHVAGRAVAAQPVTDDAQGKLIVHEWGTFTTFSGSDGQFLEFRPLVAQSNDLPNFVRDRASGSVSTLLTKSRIKGRVRMETPVTYFYTDRIREIEVSVEFKDGLLTEFYPPVREMSPPLDESAAFGAGEVARTSRLSWGRVTLIPQTSLAPDLVDPAARTWLQQHLAASVVPHAENDQHYAQARATDSALVYLQSPRIPNLPEANESLEDHIEKFLFYRGVGDFSLPIQSGFDSQENVTLRNVGADSFRSLVLTQIEGDKIRIAIQDELAPGDERTFSALHEVTLAELSSLVEARLIAEGLYPKEAAAMLATWRDSWFQEEGTRVLYMVPQSITNSILPLTINSVPDATVRVLVGRLELMTPAREASVLAAVKHSAAQRQHFLADQESKSASDPHRRPATFAVPAAITALGRMTEPALVRVSKLAPTAELRQEAELLLATLRAK